MYRGISTISMLLLLNVFLSQKNIALHKTAWQLHPYQYRNYDASKAVDGLKTNLQATAYQCTISEENYKTALWRVDLGDMLGVHHITIYYRTDNDPWGPRNGYVPRFLGFSVYISNTTKKEDGVLCFKDNQHFTNENIPAVITLNCTHHGRYVIFYNNRTSTNLPPYYSKYAFNELCEFEVYGCPNPKYFSKNCSEPCPARCNNSRCHIETGLCSGCADGYQGPACEQSNCQNSTYGAGCSEKCGHCLNGEHCNHVNGTCHSGCEAGYHDIRCKRECPSGMFGINCLQNCSENCYNESSCNGQTGACLGGCMSGWMSPLCTKECVAGKYGQNCSQDCSRYCKDSMACDKSTGECDGGCVDGWRWPMCNKECDNGTYGTNCSSNCGHCYQGQSCDKETGACPEGCGARYDRMYCNITCPRVYYGPNCDLLCNSSCYKHRCDYGNCKQENEENGVRGYQSGYMTMFIPVGGSVGVLTAIAVTVIVYKRRRGKKNQMPSTVSQNSKKQPNNKDVSSRCNDKIQDPKCHGESSSQMSDYYCDLPETGYNDNATENIYEEDVSSQYDDNIQGPKCHGESSSQKSEYYCELPETEYNDTAIVETEYHDTAIDNIYEAI